LLVELHNPLSQATLVYCDNVSVIYLFTNPVQHQCTKHVEIDLHCHWGRSYPPRPDDFSVHRHFHQGAILLGVVGGSVDIFIIGRVD
jgi:hypothetical protein